MCCKASFKLVVFVLQSCVKGCRHLKCFEQFWKIDKSFEKFDKKEYKRSLSHNFAKAYLPVIINRNMKKYMPI